MTLRVSFHHLTQSGHIVLNKIATKMLSDLFLVSVFLQTERSVEKWLEQESNYRQFNQNGIWMAALYLDIDHNMDLRVLGRESHRSENKIKEAIYMEVAPQTFSRMSHDMKSVWIQIENISKTLAKSLSWLLWRVGLSDAVLILMLKMARGRDPKYHVRSGVY